MNGGFVMSKKARKEKKPKVVETAENPEASKDQKKGGLGLGPIIEVAMVIANSTKPKEPGPDGTGGGLTLDKNKLIWGLTGFAGKQVFKSVVSQRDRKQLKAELDAGLISPEDFEEGRHAPKPKKKSSQFGLAMLIGMVVGAVGYLLAMPSDQRARFFQQIDQAVNQIVGFVNELQGKPYSQDYEPK
jgi:hypothetical protein